MKSAAPITCPLRLARPGQRRVEQRAAPDHDLDVRHHAQHAVAHLFWKPFITDSTMISAAPERNGQHGHARDEGDEAVGRVARPARC